MEEGAGEGIDLECLWPMGEVVVVDNKWWLIFTNLILLCID